MNVLVIGGTGHVGGYLVRDLVLGGHRVVSLSRGTTTPLLGGDFWDKVEQVSLDRRVAEKNGKLAELIAAVKPAAVADIICFEPESAEILFDLLAGNVQHLVHVGTAWIYGDPELIPTPETYRGVPLNDYAKKKLAIHDYYLARFAESKFPVTIANPTQITGAGKPFITPKGDKELDYLKRMRAGETLPIPGHGRVLLQHVHPSDVARVIRLALENTGAAAGQAYNAGSACGMTYLGLFNFLRGRFGSDCTARPMSMDEYEAEFGPAPTVKEHMIQSTCVDIRKAAEQLGYRPAYTAREAVADALDDLIARGELK